MGDCVVGCGKQGHGIDEPAAGHKGGRQSTRRGLMDCAVRRGAERGYCLISLNTCGASQFIHCPLFGMHGILLPITYV